MALFLNEAILAGKGYSLKQSQTKSGKTAVSFSLFVAEKMGKDEDVKSFFWVNAYDKLAESVAKYWEEGKDFYVEGRINTYKDKDGLDKFSISANTIKFI